MYEAEVLDIVDSEKAGHAKMAVMPRNAAPLVAYCLRFPGLSPTTNDIWHVMLQIALHRNVRFKTMTAEGRRCLADLLTCILTWIRRGYRIVDKLHEVLGIDPPKEYAAIMAAGSCESIASPAAAAAAVGGIADKCPTAGLRPRAPRRPPRRRAGSRRQRRGHGQGAQPPPRLPRTPL